jgi:hypothetical protein
VIGAAVALGKYDIAVILAVVNGLTLHYMKPWKIRMEGHNGEEPPKV